MNEDWKDQFDSEQLDQTDIYEHELEKEPSLPPRSRVQRRRSDKKKKFTFSFPIIRLLLFLFFLLIIAALTSPYWLS
ncbi:hypothetical protein ACFFHM_21190 [Halalkalibacter kiskunsagensis]|uniref:Uncharacterized protein n=1 Tax=Halalkalibacter kiskunsagensis TaxID=1548599 RepID=A0ABV6KI58_9BACI